MINSLRIIPGTAAILAAFITASLWGQAVPAPKATAVMVDPSNSTVVSPANFWTANKVVRNWSDLPGTTVADGNLFGSLREIRLRADDSPTAIGFERYSNAVTWLMTGGEAPDGSIVYLPDKSGTLALTSDIPAVQSPAVMVCTIQLNTASGETYTDFEFKITISNFGEHSPYTDLYLYYHSPDPARTVIMSQTGPKPSVWFVDSQYTDPRRLRKQSATQSIWTMRTNTTSRITSVMIAVPVDSVIRPDNAALVVEYLRFTPTAHESDAGGRSIWRMVEPSWRSIMPNP